jgi:isocitrate dehydrogenase
MMLVQVGLGDVATDVHNAWLRTVEDGVATADMAFPGTVAVGTQEFAAAVIARLGERPASLAAVEYPASRGPLDGDPYGPVAGQGERPQPREVVTLDGVDVFVHCDDRDPDALAGRIQQAIVDGDLELTLITNRGVKVWPAGFGETFCTDHWRCRFQGADGLSASRRSVIDLLARLDRAEIDFVKTEGLYSFDDVPGYTLGQGQ